MKIYTHKKNNKKYLKIFNSKIKIDGFWEDCIIYLCLYWNKDGFVFVRRKEDFYENFK